MAERCKAALLKYKLLEQNCSKARAPLSDINGLIKLQNYVFFFFK